MSAIPLSPIDHVFTGRGSYPIEFVFAYAGTVDADRLAASLRRTLESFSPVASRLTRLSELSYGFEPVDGGCSIEVTASPTAFADAENRSIFLRPVETEEGQPLARIKLSQTPKGSVLGVSLSHAVADGFSYFHFLSSWSRVFRGEPIAPPSHQRELLIPAVSDLEPALTPDHVRDGSGVFWDARRNATSRDRLRSNRHLLSREELKAIHQEAQRDCDVRLSHNDAIAAWLWRTYVPDWTDQKANSTTYLSCPVDHRRLLRGFPPTYFGCAVVLATVTYPTDGLREASLGELAIRVRRAVAGVDADRVTRALCTVDQLRRQVGLSVMEECHVVHPRSGLLVTNLSRLQIAAIEFDAGPPVAFHMPTPAERCAVVLPAADGVDIRVCLPVETSGTGCQRETED